MWSCMPSRCLRWLTQRNHQQLQSLVLTLWTVPYHRKHGVAPCTALATSVYTKIPCYLWWSITQSQICTLLEAMFFKLNVKLAPGWALIRVNFDPIQKIGPKVGSGCSFMSGHSFTRLRYIYNIYIFLSYPGIVTPASRFLVVSRWSQGCK